MVFFIKVFIFLLFMLEYKNLIILYIDFVFHDFT